MFGDLTRPEAAYAIGLLQTDGTHEGRLDGKGRVSIELAPRDEAVLDRLRALLPCYSSIGHRVRNTNFGTEYATATLRFYDQSTRQAVADAGMEVGRKSHTIRAPASPFSAPDYVRGLLDGDGSVGFTRRGEPFVSLVTACPAIASFVCRVVFETCGVERTARPNTRDGVFNIMVRNVAAARLAAWAWHSDDVLALEHKRRAASAVAAWRPPPEKAGRYGTKRKRWTPEDDEVVLTHGQVEAARQLERSMSSVSARKWRLTKGS